MIFRTPAYNMIPIKLRAAVRMPLYSTSRWSKLWYTSTQEGIWRNTYHCLYRLHFGPCSTWQLILASLQASLACVYPLYTTPGMHHAVKFRYGINSPGEVWSTAVYLPSWIRVNSVCKVANATLQMSIHEHFHTLVSRLISPKLLVQTARNHT